MTFLFTFSLFKSHFFFQVLQIMERSSPRTCPVKKKLRHRYFPVNNVEYRKIKNTSVGCFLMGAYSKCQTYPNKGLFSGSYYLLIESECRKIWTRKSSLFGHFFRQCSVHKTDLRVTTCKEKDHLQ